MEAAGFIGFGLVVSSAGRYYDSRGKALTVSERHLRWALPRSPESPASGRGDPDLEVLEGFLAGRPQAVARVRGWADAVARSRGWRFDDPEGVVQEILLKLVRVVRSGGFRKSSSFRTFVFSVAKHTCIDVYRAERWRSTFVEEGLEPEIPSGEESPEESARTSELRELLRYVFQRLSQECRQLWRWVYGEGLSAEEVSSRLDISVPNVRVRVHRCLEKARKTGRDFLAGPHLG